MRDDMEDEMDEEEQDVGDLASSSSKSQTKPNVPVIVTDDASLAPHQEASGSMVSASALSRGSELPSVREAETELAEEDEEAIGDVDADSPVDEADMAAMSKSMSYIDMDGTMPKRGHGHRFTSHGSEHGARRSLDWMQEEPVKKKTVITEASFSLSVSGCRMILNCTTHMSIAFGDDREETTIFSVRFVRCLGMDMGSIVHIPLLVLHLLSVSRLIVFCTRHGGVLCGSP